MANESVVIEVKDGIEKSISRNLSEISSQARAAYQNVAKLVTQLNRVKPTAIAQFNSVVSNAQRQMSQAALSAQRLATEQQRTATASANSAAAQQRVAVATANAEHAQSNAAGAAMRLEAAQTRAAASADKQAAAQQRAAAATAQQAQRLKANSVEVARINGIEDRYQQVLARNPKYQQAAASAGVKAAAAAKLQRYELNNLAFQLNDVAVGFASGQKPMTIFMQQGAQIGQVLGTSGVGAGAVIKQLGGIVGRFLVGPFGIAAVAVGAALVPFALFNREMNKGFDADKYVKGLKLTEDQLKNLKESGETLSVTFGDTFKATFQVIGRYAAAFFKPMTDQIGKWWNSALDWMMEAISTFTRAMLGLFLAIPNVVKAVFKDIPASLELMFKTGANNVIATVEGMLNLISLAIDKSGLGKVLGIEGQTTIKLPRLELSDAAQNVQTEITNALDNGFAAADKMVDKFAADVAAQARKNRDARVMAAAGDADPAKKKGGGRGFDRAKELAQINAELDAQAKNMFVLATARDAANRADEIALRFAKEGKPLRQDEIEALRNKIQALNDAKEVQQQFDRIFNNVTAAQRTYNATLEAASKLLQMGAISQAQYAAEVDRAAKAQRYALDPGQEALDQVREQIRLLGFIGPLREKEQQLEQARNRYRDASLPINEKVIEQLGREITALQQKEAIARRIDDLQANSNAQRSLNTQMNTQTAIGQIGNNGFTGGDAVADLARDNPALQATQEFAQAQIAAYQDMYAQINTLREADVISEMSAMTAKAALFAQQHEQQLTAVGSLFGSIAQLQQASGRKYKAFAIAQALISTYLSASKALAEVPYPFNFVAAASNVIAGLAQVAQIRSQNTAGYMQGGYTGNIPTNAVAGPVHGQEYVFDAPATARIGVKNLEALRRGRVPVDAIKRGEADAVSATGSTPTHVSDREVNYNQTVNVTVAGKRTRHTAQQEARAIRIESTRELVRNGG